MDTALVDKFLQSLADDGKSHLTIYTYRHKLINFAQWLDVTNRATELEAIQPGAIYEYFQYIRTNQRVKPATINLIRDTLSAFFEWAIKQKLVKENPAKSVKKAGSVKGAPKALSEETMDKLITTALSTKRQRDRAIVLTLLLTGLRESELCNLLIQDIDFAKATLTVYAGKGGKYREVPLPKQGCQILQSYINTERAEVEANYKRPLKRPYLFIGQRGPISRSTVIKIVRAMGNEIGVKCHPHMLRHTYATVILNKTGDLTAVSALLGHSSIATTQIYTRPTPELLAERVQSALGDKGIS